MKKLLALFLAFTVVLFAESYTVKFNAKMSVQVKKGNFIYGTDKVVVRGTFNSWSGDTDELTEGSTIDTVYSLDKVIDRDTAGAADQIKFKFVKLPDNWESSPDRILDVPAGVTTVTYTAWFNEDSVYKPMKDISIKFQCNMEYEIGSGRFNPPDDSLSVNGSFNGWSSKKDILKASNLNPNLYSITKTIKAAVGDKLEYKFWYEPGTWESIDNRKLEITDAIYNAGSYTVPVVYFNNGSLSTMTANPVDVKLTCNTNGAKAANGYVFQSVKTVHVAGSAKPLSWPGGGWPTSDSKLMIALYDDGTHGDAVAGDKIFSTILNFPRFTVLDVEYKYSINFGDATDNSGVNDNEGSVGGNHHLVMESDFISCTTVDTFGLSLGQKAVLKDIQKATGVELFNNTKPANYSLEQNYPNPFNPSTMIKFAVANSGLTTLKVYNMLGQEVATLVNDNLQAGTYTVDFNASNLNSGIYVYELRSGAVKIAKKMMLVK